MSAGFIQVHLDIGDVKKGFAEMRRAAFDPRPLFKSTRKAFRQDMKDHFEERRGPMASWPPRSAASVRKMTGGGAGGKNLTKKGKIRKGAQRRLRNQLGRLKTAFRLKANKREMRISSKVSWSGIHQDGGMAARGVTIPARPFVWISKLFLEMFVKAYADHVADAWEK